MPVMYACEAPKIDAWHGDNVVRVRLKKLVFSMPYTQKILQQGIYDCAREGARCRLGRKVVLAAVFVAMFCAPKGNLHCAARLKERIYNWVANLPDVASVSCAGEEVCGNGIQGTSVCLVQLLCVI